MYDQKLLSLVEKSADKFYAKTKADKHSRYISWEHCYSAFSDARDRKNYNDDVIETLCLHLFMYLASWGMLRNSFLLQKDYKIHGFVVREILDSRYDVLCGISCRELKNQENLGLLFELKEKISEYYVEYHMGDGEECASKIKKPTDTLLSKILLGTLGCVPAYDRYFRDAVRRDGIASGSFSRNSILSLCDYYMTNESQLEKVRSGMKLESNDAEYPQMKLLDMAFWEMGRDLEKKE